MPNNNTKLKAQTKATKTEINLKAWQDTILKKLTGAFHFIQKCFVINDQVHEFPLKNFPRGLQKSHYLNIDKLLEHYSFCHTKIQQITKSVIQDNLNIYLVS